MQVYKRGCGPVFDNIAYLGLCILTLGGVYFVRVIITTAIRCAFTNEAAVELREVAVE